MPFSGVPWGAMGVMQVDEGSVIPEVHSPYMDKDNIR